MATRTKHVRATEKTYNRIAKFATERGISMTDVITDSVEEYMSNTPTLGALFEARYDAKRHYDYLMKDPNGRMALHIVELVEKFLTEQGIKANIRFMTDSPVLKLIITEVVFQRTALGWGCAGDEYIDEKLPDGACIIITKELLEHTKNAYHKLYAEVYKALLAVRDVI